VTETVPATEPEDATVPEDATEAEDATEPAVVLAATHHVPPGGIDWWSDPDPEREPDGTLDPFLAVEVPEETTGWAHVRASNGWEGWVDASLLVAGDATETLASASPRPRVGKGARISIALSIAGAVIAIVGGFLPWYSAGGADVTAWDIRLVALLTKEPTDMSLEVGPVLLLAALSLVALVLRRPLPAWAAIALAGVPLVLGVAGLLFYLDLPGSSADLGIGVIATLIGAVVMLAGVALSPRMVPRPLVRFA
jgi:hypothetical protein